MKKQGLKIFALDTSTELLIPVVGKVVAGFPSPAGDYLDQSIDLNKEFIKHPASTFMAIVDGDSMIDADLKNGDYLIIDRSEPIIDKKMYVCYVDGDFTVKYIKKDNDIVWLVPANKDFKPIKVTADNEFIVWGRIIKIIKNPPILV